MQGEVVVGQSALRLLQERQERPSLCYASNMLGLNHGELFLVAFVVLTVLLAPYSGRFGQWLASLVNPRGS